MLDQVRTAVFARHYSRRTEDAHVQPHAKMRAIGVTVEVQLGPELDCEETMSGLLRYS